MNRVAVLACGNPSRGDDAMGPLLLERLESWTPYASVDLRLIGDMQWQVEHALDLRDMDAVLFVDAAASGAEPFELRRVAAAQDPSYTTHALSPAAVLHVAEQVNPGAPPPAWVLGIRGHDFALGEPLSAAATENLEAAWSEVIDLLSRPLAEWPGR